MAVEGEDGIAVFSGDDGDDRVAERHSDSPSAQFSQKIAGLFPVFTVDFRVGDGAEKFFQVFTFLPALESLKQLSQNRPGPGRSEP